MRNRKLPVTRLARQDLTALVMASLLGQKPPGEVCMSDVENAHSVAYWILSRAGVIHRHDAGAVFLQGDELKAAQAREYHAENCACYTCAPTNE